MSRGREGTPEEMHTWSPTLLETSRRKARGVCLGESSQLGDRRDRAVTLCLCPPLVRGCSWGTDSIEPPMGLGRGSTHLFTSVQT